MLRARGGSGGGGGGGGSAPSRLSLNPLAVLLRWGDTLPFTGSGPYGSGGRASKEGVFVVLVNGGVAGVEEVGFLSRTVVVVAPAAVALVEAVLKATGGAHAGGSRREVRVDQLPRAGGTGDAALRALAAAGLGVLL